MTILRKQGIALSVILCAVIGVMANAYPGKNSSALEDRTGSQDVRSLDRRINLLEQRLYSIETSINLLQRSAISQPTPGLRPSAREHEINLLRGELQTLQLRLTEIECGLVKLDERTIASDIREARKSGGAKTGDPCRLNPATPLRLSGRP